MAQAMVWYHLNGVGLNSLSSPSLASASDSLSSDLATIDSTAQMVSLTPNQRALAYGDGFFSTLGVHKAQLQWQSYHQARILSHCHALQLELPIQLEQRLWQTLSKLAQAIEEGIIKIIVSRPEQSLRGYAYSAQPEDNEVLIWIGVLKTPVLAQQTAQFLELDKPIQSSAASIFQQPPIVAKCLQSQLASLPHPLAGLKSLNRLDGVMIAGELQRYKQRNSKIAEGLVADMQGQWVEGVMSNVFYRIRTNVDSVAPHPVSEPWYTPPITHSGVRGVMRQVIIDRFASLGMPVEERCLTSEDLSQLEAMFFCNAVRGVIPVQQLLLEEGAVSLSLQPFNKNSVLT